MMMRRRTNRFHTPVRRERERERQYHFTKDLAPLLNFQKPLVAQLREIAGRRPDLSRWIAQIQERLSSELYIYEGTHSQIMKAARKLGVPQRSVFRHVVSGGDTAKSEFIRPLASQRDGTYGSTSSETAEPYNNACDPQQWQSDDRDGSYITTKKARQPLREVGLIQPFPLVAPSKKEWRCCGLPYIRGDSQSNGCWISDSDDGSSTIVPYRLFPSDPTIGPNPSKDDLRAYLESTTVQKGTAWLDKEYFDDMHEEISGDRNKVAMTLWKIANGKGVTTMELNTTAKVYGLIDRYNDPQRPDSGPEAPHFLGGDPVAWLTFLTTKAFRVMRPNDPLPSQIVTMDTDMTTVQIRNPKRNAEPFFPQPVLPQLLFDGKKWRFDNDDDGPVAPTLPPRQPVVPPPQPPVAPPPPQPQPQQPVTPSSPQPVIPTLPQPVVSPPSPSPPFAPTPQQQPLPSTPFPVSVPQGGRKLQLDDPLDQIIVDKSDNASKEEEEEEREQPPLQVEPDEGQKLFEFQRRRQAELAEEERIRQLKADEDVRQQRLEAEKEKRRKEEAAQKLKAERQAEQLRLDAERRAREEKEKEERRRLLEAQKLKAERADAQQLAEAEKRKQQEAEKEKEAQKLKVEQAEAQRLAEAERKKREELEAVKRAAQAEKERQEFLKEREERRLRQEAAQKAEDARRREAERKRQENAEEARRLQAEEAARQRALAIQKQKEEEDARRRREEAAKAAEQEEEKAHRRRLQVEEEDVLAAQKRKQAEEDIKERQKKQVEALKMMEAREQRLAEAKRLQRERLADRRERDTERKVITTVVLEKDGKSLEDVIRELTVDEDLQQFFAFARNNGGSARRLASQFKRDFAKFIIKDDVPGLQTRIKALKGQIRVLNLEYPPDQIPLSAAALRFELNPNRAKGSRAVRRVKLALEGFVAYAKRVEASRDVVEDVNGLLNQMQRLNLLRAFLAANQNAEQREKSALDIERQSNDLIERGQAITRELQERYPNVKPVSKLEIQWLLANQENRIPVDPKERIIWVLDHHWELRQWQATNPFHPTMLSILDRLKITYRTLKSSNSDDDNDLFVEAQQTLDDGIAKLRIAKGVKQFQASQEPIDVADWRALLSARSE